jgi:hypothetical protein
MSELGFPAMVGFLISIAFLIQTRRLEDFGDKTRFVVLAVTVWLFHNLIDINVYFPSLGVLGFVLIGVLLSRPETKPVLPSKVLATAVTVITLCIVAAAIPIFIANELEHRSRIEQENGKLPQTIATLAAAKQFNPLNSSLHHLTGETALELFHRTQKQEYLQLAQTSFEKAISLSPLKVGPHVGLGLCFSTANRMDDALREIHIAQKLYPNSDYARSVEALIEKRRRGEFSPQSH